MSSRVSRIKGIPYFPGSRIEIQMFHFHDKIKNRPPATVGKTVEEISLAVHMEGIGIIAVMPSPLLDKKRLV